MPTPTLRSRARTSWRQVVTWAATIRWFSVLALLFAVAGVVLTIIRPQNEHPYWALGLVALVFAVLSIREE